VAARADSAWSPRTGRRLPDVGVDEVRDHAHGQSLDDGDLPASPWQGRGLGGEGDDGEEAGDGMQRRATPRLGHLGPADELPVDGFFGGERVVTGRKRRRRSSGMESSSVKDEGTD
jgi:hypothetical protein